jgi:hypothetical protein
VSIVVKNQLVVGWQLTVVRRSSIVDVVVAELRRSLLESPEGDYSSDVALCI